MHPNRRVRSQQRRTLRQIRNTDAYAFFDLLTDEATLDRVESLLPVHRERLLPPTETLAMFMAQALNADPSCQNAINEFSARRVSGGLSTCSTSTGDNGDTHNSLHLQSAALAPFCWRRRKGPQDRWGQSH